MQQSVSVYIIKKERKGKNIILQMYILFYFLIIIASFYNKNTKNGFMKKYLKYKYRNNYFIEK